MNILTVLIDKYGKQMLFRFLHLYRCSRTCNKIRRCICPLLLPNLRTMTNSVNKKHPKTSVPFVTRITLATAIATDLATAYLKLL